MNVKLNLIFRPINIFSSLFPFQQTSNPSSQYPSQVSATTQSWDYASIYYVGFGGTSAGLGIR